MGLNVLVTGCAGFIGFHTARALLERGDEVIGVDNLNEYYNKSLKQDRLNLLKEYENFTFYELDFSKGLEEVKEEVNVICHLGAQAGVRYSLEEPLVYEESNLKGTLQVFEYARNKNINKIVYASSSSVYGNCTNPPFKEDYDVGKPISLYAATKRACELMAYTYHHLYNINMIGLRFFTVYGPWGRPDMALFKFVKRIFNNEPIDVYNHGKMKRDFTYVDDIISGVLASIDSNLNYEIINLARGEVVTLMEFINTIEEVIGEEAEKNMMPLQPGDVLLTSGNINKAKELLNYEPRTSLKEGVKNFVNWYKKYYKIR